MLPKVEKPNILTETVDTVLNWGRSRSIWMLTYSPACCAMELMAVGGPHYDIARFGSEIFRPSPRHADLMFVAGTINNKMVPVLKRLYEQMAEPKWVIAYGACTITGGLYHDSYYVVQGLDKLVPVDVYVSGCPPRPEAIIAALLELRKKIMKFENFGERGEPIRIE